MVAHQVRRRIAGIQRRGNGAVGHDPQVGQVEFQARLGVQRHHVAMADPQRAQARGDLPHGLEVLVPGERQVAAAGRRLAQGRQIAVVARGFFEDVVESAGGHKIGHRL